MIWKKSNHMPKTDHFVCAEVSLAICGGGVEGAERTRGIGSAGCVSFEGVTEGERKGSAPRGYAPRLSHARN
jgi:hypothetical protein